MTNFSLNKCVETFHLLPTVISWHDLRGSSGYHHKFEAHEKLMRQGHQQPLRCAFKELLLRIITHILWPEQNKTKLLELNVFQLK